MSAASAPASTPHPLKSSSVQAGSAQHQTATPSSGPTIPTSNIANNAWSAASKDKKNARETLSVEKEVPKGTTRFTIPVHKAKTVGQEKGVHVTRVRHELLSHFDGDARLAPLPGYEVPEDAPYKSLLGLTTGARLHQHAAPSVLKNLVELRLELLDLNMSDKAIVEGIKPIVKSKDYELVAVQKYYHASETASGNPVLTFQGRFSFFLRFPSLAKDAARSHHQHLESTLPTLMRWDSTAAAALDLPFTGDEVAAAIKTTALGSSPGHSGLRYEFFRANSSLLSSDFATTFNSWWEEGRLPPSQTLAQVRLLLEDKPGADPQNLKYWCPISLRESVYKI
ncbi:hypothetical protein JCM8547_001067 [Rhodosporidiobolus lusitaniae]